MVKKGFNHADRDISENNLIKLIKTDKEIMKYIENQEFKENICSK